MQARVVRVVDRRGHGRIPSPPSQLIDSGAEPVSLEVDTEGEGVMYDMVVETTDTSSAECAEAIVAKLEL
jgi:chloramphenicol 3-O-phosphotransferase